MNLKTNLVAPSDIIKGMHGSALLLAKKYNMYVNMNTSYQFLSSFIDCYGQLHVRRRPVRVHSTDRTMIMLRLNGYMKPKPPPQYEGVTWSLGKNIAPSYPFPYVHSLSFRNCVDEWEYGRGPIYDLMVGDMWHLEKIIDSRRHGSPRIRKGYVNLHLKDYGYAFL